MRWASLRPRVAESSVVMAPRSSRARRISIRRSCSSWMASGSSSGSSSSSGSWSLTSTGFSPAAGGDGG
ncbi:MAG: hypothetical protein QOI98_532 [Solirubrobacteraceae bacterium]|nr:hypothetical protein [Solirubrobacteraceae bacterium]